MGPVNPPSRLTSRVALKGPRLRLVQLVGVRGSFVATLGPETGTPPNTPLKADDDPSGSLNASSTGRWSTSPAILGCTAYHPAVWKWSEPRWPDLALIKPPRFIIAELKREAGKTTPDQERWLAMLRGQGAPTAGSLRAKRSGGMGLGDGEERDAVYLCAGRIGRRPAWALD